MSLEWAEYLVVASSLILSVWLGVKSKNTGKNESNDDYIKSEVPLGYIILSLVAAETSGMSMLGKPAEAYMHGMEFFYTYVIGGVGCIVLSSYIFVPILTQLDTPSLYDYFELRFNARVKQLTSVTFVILKVFYTGTSVIPPAIVIAHFSEINVNYIIAGLCSVTIFYTAVGGLKGVIWTDVLQGIIMFASMGFLTVASVGQVGGLGRVMSLAYETGRTHPPSVFTADVTERSSIWVYLSFLYSLSPIFLNHSSYQRVKNLDARKMNLSLWFLVSGMILMSLGATFTGLSMYAFYYGCDPKENERIPSYSNLVVFWLNDLGHRIVGLRGVYIGGIACASISSMATHMNSSADVICKEMTRKWSNIDRTLCMRCLTIITGVLGSIFAFYFIKSSGSLIELSYCVMCIEGIISSLFIMGAVFVRANATGALTGGLCSLVFALFASLGSRIFLSGYKMQYSTKYMSTDSCVNSSVLESSMETVAQKMIPTTKPFFLFTISPFCVGILAVLISLTVGLVVSLIFPENTGSSTSSRSPDLYAPFLRSYVTSDSRRRSIVHLVALHPDHRLSCSEQK